MAIQPMGDNEFGVWVCTTTGTAFGPLFDSIEEADKFCNWVNRHHGDPRRFDTEAALDLTGLLVEWREFRPEFWEDYETGIPSDEEQWQEWDHDCTGCIFMGQVSYAKGYYDAHYCADEVAGPTIVLRYGDEGHEYISATVETIREYIEIRGEENTNPAYIEALARLKYYAK